MEIERRPKFEEVVPFWAPNEADFEINTMNSKSYFGSNGNETMQNVVALMHFFL